MAFRVTYFLTRMLEDLPSRMSSLESSKLKQLTLSSSASFLRDRGRRVTSKEGWFVSTMGELLLEQAGIWEGVVCGGWSFEDGVTEDNCGGGDPVSTEHCLSRPPSRLSAGGVVSTFASRRD